MDTTLKYVRRAIESELLETLNSARVVVLTGPRQSGKTTLVTQLAETLKKSKKIAFHNLDNRALRDAANHDPNSLINSPNIDLTIIDEIQLADDDLIRAIKEKVDTSNLPGQFLLTGSADFLTVPHISESLAGRAVFLQLWPLSQAELSQRSTDYFSLLTSPQENLLDIEVPAIEMQEYLQRISVGGFPESLRIATEKTRRLWLDSYQNSLLQRDIKDFSEVRSLPLLKKMLRLFAARTANELLTADMVRDASTTRVTFERYTALLEIVYLIHQLPVWSRNITSRESKRPKVYIADTGLATHLLRTNSKALLQPTNPMRGQLFETFIVNELMKHVTTSALYIDLYHYRTHKGEEVDIIAEIGDQIVSFEIKAASSVKASDTKQLVKLRDRLDAIEPHAFVNGILFYSGTRILSFGDRITAMPISFLWS